MRDLEPALRALGEELEFPPTPDLAVPVAVRLGADAVHLRRRRPLVLAFAALLGAAVAAALAVPQARTALLELLGVPGASVERVETLPPTAEGAPLAPGARVSFEEARAAVDFPVLAPPAKDGRRCGAFYLDRSVPGGMVTVVCPERGPRRYVLTQFRGAQTPYVSKEAGPGARVDEVDVAGARGLWIRGAPHVVEFRDADGRAREQTRRLAGDVLLWERGGVTYRLEGELHDREHALRIAADLR